MKIDIPSNIVVIPIAIGIPVPNGRPIDPTYAWVFARIKLPPKKPWNIADPAAHMGKERLR
jgi:hypothetical protein